LKYLSSKAVSNPLRFPNCKLIFPIKDLPCKP
jgi:hypothetical protein